MGFLKFHPSFSGKRDSGENLKKVLALVLAFACAFTMFAGAAFTDSADIKVKSEVVNTLVSLGVVNGYDDGSFKPNGTVTRAEMAKMIYVLRTGNSDASAYNDDKTSFTDIGSHWARGYIKYCQSLGIIAGKSNTKFVPNEKVSAQEAAKMLLVTLGYNAQKAGLVGTGWASKTNALADENGLLKDVTTSFTAACPRQYAAQLIYNAIFAPTVVWRDDAYTNKTLMGNEDLPTVGEKFMGLKNPKGILTSVKYDDNDKTYTTVIDGDDDLSFDATADYSALMGQQVKALYKEGKNGDDDTLYGIYATDKNKTVTTLVDDIDKYDGGFKVNGKEYDFADDVSFVAPNGKQLTYVNDKDKTVNVTKYSELAAYHTVTFVDNNNDKKYEYAVCDPFTVAKVDSLTAKKAYFEDALKDTITTSVDRDDLDAYDKIAKDDYVVLTNKDYSVSGNTVAVKADEVSGKVAGTKTDKSIKVDGNWYKQAAATVDAPDSGDTLKYAIVKSGFYFATDCKNGSTDKLALVLKVSKDSDFDGDYYDVKVLLSDGTTKVSKGYVKAGSSKNKPDVGTLYTYTTNNTGYVLEDISDGDDIGMDTDVIDGGTYDPKTNKVTATVGSAKTRLAADAKVFVMYGTNKGKVVTGAAADKWSDGSYTVTKAYTDTTVKVMVVSNAKNPSISDDSLYGVILSEPYSDKNADDEDIVVIDKFLTENGIVTDLKIDVDDFAMSTLKKNMLVSYQMDGKDYVKFNTVADGATAAVGAITDVDGDYVTVLTDNGTVDLKVDKSDSHILYVDTDAEDAASGSIKKATKKDKNTYYANIMVIYKTTAENDESHIIWGAAIDSANQLQDSNDEDVTVTIH
ncbi:S-layer homology domain-containing protein [Butyricicoccus sp. AM27-36]|uniref:S-layer homology domain-containing protein n=1 Tax=Butyricicoccus sp. AM27-36 TaxID=2292293 RepID=UPI000E466966|nr:S-layer homology domain-containing protein [Butyricicoccus sp. AM27-36]RHT86563.1 S-layer homology domain-containing protein [Butyricicoccus sp. AM27-36]